MHDRNAYELDPSETPSSLWQQILSAFNPMELWRAWREAEDAICLMAPVPVRQRGQRR